MGCLVCVCRIRLSHSSQNHCFYRKIFSGNIEVLFVYESVFGNGNRLFLRIIRLGFRIWMEGRGKQRRNEEIYDTD